MMYTVWGCRCLHHLVSEKRGTPAEILCGYCNARKLLEDEFRGVRGEFVLFEKHIGLEGKGQRGIEGRVPKVGASGIFPGGC